MKDKIKTLNLKKLMKVFVILMGLVLIVFTTLTSIGLNEFNFLTWLGNALILIGIIIFGLLMGESVGTDKTKEAVEGLYQKALRKYNEIRAKVNDFIIYFSQFFHWYMPQELENKKIEYLIMCGIQPLKAKNIVVYCEISDLFLLKEHAIEKEMDNGQKVIIRKLDASEFEAVEDVLTGKIKLECSSPNYYLSAFGTANNVSVLEEGGRLEKDRKINRHLSRWVKIVSAIGISLIWALFTVRDFQGNNTQAIINLISRIFGLAGALFSGWLSAVTDVRLQSEILDAKSTVLTIFDNSLEKKLFIPKSEEELAKAEYEEYLKEQEQAKENVVEPTQIAESNSTILIEQKI